MKQYTGIIFYEKPYNINFIDFGYSHIGCDSIIVDKESPDGTVDVICYASEPKYNDTLYNIYNEEYKDKGYSILQRISSLEASSID